MWKVILPIKRAHISRFDNVTNIKYCGGIDRKGKLCQVEADHVQSPTVLFYSLISCESVLASSRINLEPPGHLHESTNRIDTL